MLRGIAKGSKKVVIQFSYPGDEVGNKMVDPEAVRKLYPTLPADDPYLYMMIRDNHTLDFHENQPYTTLWLDGNHENFDVIDFIQNIHS